MRLAMLGPPGSGKSTQAERLSLEYSLLHIYPGELLRREVLTNSPFVGRIRSHLDEGTLVPSDIVLYLVEREIARSHSKYILDGFPRNMEQTLELEFLLDELGETLSLVVYLVVNEGEILKRLLARGRPDDTPELIRQRIRVFERETGPVLKLYKEKKLLLEAGGEGDADQVTERILIAIRKMTG